MSGDKELIGMVNDPERARRIQEQEEQNQKRREEQLQRQKDAQARKELDEKIRRERKREFWVMARAALSWILLGAVILLLMVLDQVAVWLASSCTCGCIVAAAIVIDRYVMRRRHG